MVSYGDYPGVKVTTVSQEIDMSRDLTFEEKVETMVCIYHCIGSGYIDTNAVQSALESIGYSPYETMPMFQETLEALGEEIETFK